MRKFIVFALVCVALACLLGSSPAHAGKGAASIKGTAGSLYWEPAALDVTKGEVITVTNATSPGITVTVGTRRAVGGGMANTEMIIAGNAANFTASGRGQVDFICAFETGSKTEVCLPLTYTDDAPSLGWLGLAALGGLVVGAFVWIRRRHPVAG